MNVAVKYSLFAVISITLNLLAQDIAITVYTGPYSLSISILMGTGVGLVTKYLLDKRFIFSYRAQTIADDVGKFAAYTMTGVLTTAVFWGFEFGFDYIFATKFARYSGAILGLTIGYIVKYQLDKRMVFIRQGD